MTALIAALLLALSAHSAEECAPVLRQPAYELRSCGNLKLLRLQGTPQERAKTIGSLMREGHLSRSVVDYFSLKIFEGSRGALAKSFFSLGYHQIVRLFHRATPAPMAEEIDAIAEGLGEDSIFLKRAVSLPDTASALVTFNASTLPAGGCTSVAKKDKNGSFFVGRNLDFTGVGIWDSHPLLLQIVPEKGSRELKHLVFAADGALFGGITGVNEAGITFAVHQNYSKDSSLTGMPMMLIGELVLREARSLADAEAILRRHRPAVLWTFVLSDLKNGEAMAVESSSRRFSVRRMENGNGLVQTNHAMDKAVAALENISVGTKMNSVHRMKTAEAMLAQGSLGPARIASILSHQDDPEGELSAYRDILKAHNIQAVVFAAPPGALGKVYVSHEAAPAAGGRYMEFDLEELFGAAAPRFRSVDLAGTPPGKRKRQIEIAQAFSAYFDEKNVRKAEELLSGHRSLDAALFRVSARYQQGYFQDSLAQAEAALLNPRFQGEPGYILHSMEWLKLASLVRMGKAAEARIQAEKILAENPLNLRLRELAQAVAKGDEPPQKLLRLAFEFFSGDLGVRPN